MKLAKAISERIRTLREAAAISQQDLAMKADLSLSLVAKLEQGKKADPRTSTLLALAKALQVTPGDLLNNLPVMVDEEEPGKENSPKEKKSKKKRKKQAKEKSKS
jgi:transcriptional regulator with XRE-family HTH domain